MRPFDIHEPGLSQKQAWDRVASEVRAGRMVQPGACAVCDCKEKLWGHHWRGYEYPLDVWWVCSSCNRLLTVHDGTQTLEMARAEMPGLKAGGGRVSGGGGVWVPVTLADLVALVPGKEEYFALLGGGSYACTTQTDGDQDT